MTQKLIELCKIFQLDGEYLSFEEIGNGYINNTYCVRLLNGCKEKKYIFQKINTYVFKDPVGMMKNVSSVAEFIRRKVEGEGSDDNAFLHYEKTPKREYFHIFPDGEFWRCCRFVQGSKTILKPENEYIVEECGRAFGEFQKRLFDYPVSELNIVIPHFHNTLFRFNALREGIKNNLAKRKDLVADEIARFFELEEVACALYKMQTKGKLPLRVTHNDTKISNVLFDEKTEKRLCVIDLDTVMPGLVAFDFGDAIRVVANKSEEDEKDLSKCGLDIQKYEAFTKGFLEEVSESLNESEKRSLALGAVTMTVECGVRFLTDYLNGDKYFRVDYPTHNLDRARCQLTLAYDMLKNFGKMQEITKRYQ